MKEKIDRILKNATDVVGLPDEEMKRKAIVDLMNAMDIHVISIVDEIKQDQDCVTVNITISGFLIKREAQ